MDTKYLFYMKSIATFALKFFGYIILVLASVSLHPKIQWNLRIVTDK